MNRESGPDGWPLVVIGLVTIALGIYTIWRRKVLPGPHQGHRPPIEGDAAVPYGVGYIVVGIVMILIGVSISV
jgi:uncharacterized membrane protein YfcA